MSNIPAAIEKRSSARGYQPEKLIGVELDALVKTGDVSRETERSGGKSVSCAESAGMTM